MHYHSLKDPGHTHSYHDTYAKDNNINTGNDKGFYMDEDDVNQDHERLSESGNTGISILHFQNSPSAILSAKLSTG